MNENCCRKIAAENVDIKMSTLMLNCTARFWRFSNVRLFQLYGTDYISALSDTLYPNSFHFEV